MDTTKVEIISKSVDELVAKVVPHVTKDAGVWDTLIPLLVGAGLTLLTQFLIELWKSRKEKRQIKQALISKGRAKTYLIAQILKDLAMYKVHKQYYIRAYKLATDAEARNDSYKKHYEKGQEQRIIEAKLDDNIADYFSLVTEYTIISGKKDHFQSNFQKIFTYKHPKASKFENCDTEQGLVAELEKEEDRLNIEYQQLIGIFEEIQQNMS